jgi:serine/threonine-protein kinase RsbW
MRTDPVVFRFVMKAVPELVPIARHRVIAELRSHGVWLDEEAATAVELVTTELITNAVVHATDTKDRFITIGVYARGLRVVIDVHDGSHLLPKPRIAGDQSEGGRGLELVAALSLSHGWEETEGGKHCWAQLALPPEPKALTRRRLLQLHVPHQHVGTVPPRGGARACDRAPAHVAFIRQPQALAGLR